MRRLWIHIGTPKTGSTSLQRFARLRNEYLKSKGVDFLVRRKRAAFNDLAIFMRNGNAEQCQAVGEMVRRKIAESDAHTFVMSSEMFTGVDPLQLKQILALDEQFDTRIIAYFRRQDRYLESAYKQKMKTGKIAPDFENYVKKYGINGGSYLPMVNRWQAGWPEAVFDFRRFEPDRFPKRDVVYDFMSMLEIDIDADGKPPSDEADNPTPTIDLLDLMQVVAQVRGLDARMVFRGMPISTLPRFKGRVMGHDQARALLAQFEDQNEELRKRFFPDDKTLFRSDDLDGPPPEIAKSSFTPEQRALVLHVLRAATAYARDQQG